MKSFIIALAAAATIIHAAEIQMYADNFRLPSWQILNSTKRLKVDNKTLIVDTDKRILPAGVSIRGEQPFGARFKVTVTNTEQGKYKIGFLLRGYKKENKFYMSNDLQGTGTFEVALPMNARNLTPIIWGKGKYKNIKVVRLMNYDYRIAAYPSYQLVKDPAKAEKVTFSNNPTYPSF